MKKEHFTQEQLESYISDEPITEKDLAELNHLLDKTKVGLFFQANAGFLAPLVATIKFDWDRSIPTAATNGVFMIWNPEFFKDLDYETRISVLAHEAWHIAYQHALRRGSRHPEVYNHAADYVINNMLKESGYYMDGFPFLLDTKFNGMNTEQVYDKLMEDIDILPWNPQNGDFFPADDGDAPSSMTQGMSPEEIEATAKANIIDAHTVAKMNQQAGNIPGEVKSLIEEFLNPKLHWTEILYQFFESLAAKEFSYQRPSRRSTEVMLPGPTGRNGLEHIIYYLDVSGSITDKQIQRFNSEVKHIKDTFNPELFTMVQFDTRIQQVIELEEDEDFESVEVIGRGGTSLKEVYRHAREESPTAIVIFTDLWVDIPQEPPGMPVIWICNDKGKNKVPYGTLIHIPDEECE